MLSPLDRPGDRTVDVPRRGAPLDSSLDSGGGTGAAPQLQALQDLAQSGPLHLVIDGIHVVERADRQGSPVIDVSDAAIGPLRVRGSSWRREGLGAGRRAFLPAAGSSLGAPLPAGIDAERRTNLPRQAGATLPRVRAIGWTCAEGSGAAVTTAGTNASFAGAGNVGLTTSGTVTNNGLNL